MNQDDIIRMAREAWGLEFIPESDTPKLERFFQAAYAAGATAERKNKPHSLGPGEMELSLRREHKGELFEYRYRFTAEQVMHGPDWLVEETAKKLDFEMDDAIRARGKLG